MVKVHVIGLYLSIPDKANLIALREALDEKENEHIPTDNLLKLQKCKVKKQLLGTAIGTMFAPTYTIFFMNKLESDFLKSQELIQLFWHGYINDIFFSGLMMKKIL